MAQHIQIDHPLANGCGGTRTGTRRILDAATCDHALAIERRVGGIVSKPFHYVGRYDGHACPSIKHNRDNQRRTVIGGFKQKVYDNGRDRWIENHPGHYTKVPKKWRPGGL